MDRMILKNTSASTLSPFFGSVVLPILKHKKMSYLIVASSMAVTLIYCLLVKNQYASTATMLPSGNNNISSELKDLAAGSLGELGLGSSNQASENSSALFPNILASRLLTEKILTRNYTFNHKSRSRSMTLEDYIDAPNRDLALRNLRKLVRIESERRTGVITLSVTTRYPELSAAVVHAYLEELDDYNVHHRQYKAAENEKFTFSRLREIKEELGRAEDSLATFLNYNRNYMNSSDAGLQMELSRLQRDVDLKSSLYLTVSQQYELARLEAAKDIPVVQVLDRGAVPTVKSGPQRSAYLLGSLLGSLLAALLASLWLELSIRRGLKHNLEQVISSPEVKMNKIESRIASRIAGISVAADREELKGQQE